MINYNYECIIPSHRSLPETRFSTIGPVKNDFLAKLSTCLHIVGTAHDTASDLTPLKRVIGLEFVRPLHMRREHCLGGADGPWFI